MDVMTADSEMRRRTFLTAAGGAASVALTGVASGDRGGLAAAQQGDDVLNLINSTMTTLDPIAAEDTASGTVIQNVHDALMNYPNGEIEVEALLAEEFEVSEDFTTYTFSLTDATFHNGDELTANDVVYSFERLAASDNSARQYFILDNLGIAHETETVEGEEGEEVEEYVPGSLAVEAVDDSTVEITLDRPFASALEMLAYSAFSVVPEGIVGDIEGYDGEVDYDAFATQESVGCGPFVFESWNPDVEAEVSRFDDYHGEVAEIAGVHWQILEDDDAIYTYGMNRNADLIVIPDPQYDPNLVQVEETDDLGREIGTYGPLENGDTVNYTATSTIDVFYFGLNAQTVPLEVRQAIAYAHDHEEGVQQVFKGRGESAFHLTPPAIWPGGPEEYAAHAEGYPYSPNETDLESARQVMEEGGYGPNDRAEITLTTYDSESFQELAQLIRDKVTDAYIDIDIEQAPFSTLLQRGQQGDLEMYTLGWIMDWPAADNFLQQIAPANTATGADYTGGFYLDWTGTEAAERAQSAWEQVQENPAPTDEAEAARNEAYVQMEEAIWEDVPLLPLYHRLDERFAYDHVEIEPYGGAGGSRQKYNRVSLE